MVQFLSIIFFPWISSVFVGVFKSSRFLCHSVRAQVYPAYFLIYLICAAVILLASLALVVQCSVPYISAGMATLLRNFIRVFFKILFFPVYMLTRTTRGSSCLLVPYSCPPNEHFCLHL